MDGRETVVLIYQQSNIAAGLHSLSIKIVVGIEIAKFILKTKGNIFAMSETLAFIFYGFSYH